MRFKIIIQIIILVSTSFSFAQETISDLAFYPLQKGNYWEYSETHSEYPIIYKELYYSLEVIGDTILSNNIKYHIIRKKIIPDTLDTEFIFERIDSTTYNVYRYSNEFDFINDEYLIDSLTVQLGDTAKSSRNDPWNSYHAATVCFKSTTETLFNKEVRTKDFANINYIPGFDYRLAENIGLVKFTDFGEIVHKYTKLLYAEIQEKEYGNKIYTKVDDLEVALKKHILFQNYPNPFNVTTTINYIILDESKIQLNIFNINGQIIKTINRGREKVGQHSILFNASLLPSGIYIYELKANNFTKKRCFTLIK